MFRKILFFSIILLPFAAGTLWWICTPSEPSAPITTWEEKKSQINKLEQTLKSLAQDIRALQGKGVCTASTQCRIVGLGVKTCGGFLDSLIYSTQDVNESLLLKRINEFNQAAEQLNTSTFKVPECGKPLPNTRCTNHFCDVEK